MKHLDAFPKLTEAEYQHMLRLPDGPMKIVIDTDARNEIDDQFALAWALLSRDQMRIEAIYAAPYSFRNRLDELRAAHALRKRGAPFAPEETDLIARYGAQIDRLLAKGRDIASDSQLDPQDLTMVTPAVGMLKSYEEILIVYDKMGITDGPPVFKGSERYLTSYDDPVRSPAVEHLIAAGRAASPDAPLHIVAIGAPTNVASALLLAPDIIRNVVVSWTAGYPTTITDVFQESFNMEQDMLSSQLLFDCGVPMVYLPGYHIGAQLSISMPEMEAWVRGQGAIGDYLYELYADNPHYPFQGIDDHYGRTWIIWDLINFAWLMHPDWVPSYIIDAPLLSADRKWQRGTTPRYPIREGLGINRDAIYRDFFTKLAQAAR